VDGVQIWTSSSNFNGGECVKILDQGDSFLDSQVEKQSRIGVHLARRPADSLLILHLGWKSYVIPSTFVPNR